VSGFQNIYGKLWVFIFYYIFFFLFLVLSIPYFLFCLDNNHVLELISFWGYDCFLFLIISSIYIYIYILVYSCGFLCTVLIFDYNLKLSQLLTPIGKKEHLYLLKVLRMLGKCFENLMVSWYGSYDIIGNDFKFIHCDLINRFDYMTITLTIWPRFAFVIVLFKSISIFLMVCYHSLHSRFYAKNMI